MTIVSAQLFLRPRVCRRKFRWDGGDVRKIYPET
jgi:hypothetical protein